jgi:penicillin amidase
MSPRMALRKDRSGNPPASPGGQRAPARSRARRWGLGALAVLALLVGGVGWQVRRQLPDFDARQLRGLQGGVEVTFDDRGVASVRAQSLTDAFRAQGYLMARERLFQMELQRRAAGGELAEIAGPGALPLDRLHRIYGFAQVADAAVAKLSRADRENLEALAGGINAFIESHEGRWGLEFRLMGFRPRPWRVADSLRTLLLMHEDLASSWKSELQAEHLAKLPPATRAFLMPRVVDQDSPMVPDTFPVPAPSTRAFFAEARPARPATPPQAAAALAELPFPLPLGTAMGQRPDGIGSNAWAVAGHRSATGQALLASDPHLGLQSPGIWLPMRLEVGGRTVQGVALPGLPGIIIGHNDHIAWGFTNVGTDVQDLYREPALRHRQERIAVKGAAASVLEVAEGAHGPQVVDGYSLKWSALEPANVAMPTEHLFATDWASFNAGMDRFLGPAQNVVYADRGGHVGYRATGLIPIRRPGDDGSAPRDGTDPANDWKGYVPMAQMPRTFDPPSGFIATANNRTIGTSFPVPVTAEWASPARVRRILEQLNATHPLDRSAMERLQRDEVSLAHRELMEAWRPYLPAELQARFLNWDGAAALESTLFPEAVALNKALREALLEKLLAGMGVAPETFHWYNSEAMLLAALRAGPAAWRRAGLGDKGALLRAVLQRVAAEPRQPWGETNRLRLRHPLGRGGALLSWLFDPPQASVGGSSRSVRVTGAAFGQSMRMVVDWNDPDATTLVLPLGVSGHLGSPHRHDQFEDWLKGDPAGLRTRLRKPPTGPALTFTP